MDHSKNDPCMTERKASYKCLNKHNYNRDACELYLQAYKECKKNIKSRRNDDTESVPTSATSNDD